MTYSICSFAQKPEYRDEIDRLTREVWPAYLLYGGQRHWQVLFDVFPEFQLLLCDPEGRLLAVGHTVPLPWDGTLSDLPSSMDDILARARHGRQIQEASSTLCAVAAMVEPERRGLNLSTVVISQMKVLARQYGCRTLIAPVRPTWKSRYPLTPMHRYVNWLRKDGTPLDPWIRVHWRLGARPLGLTSTRLTVEAKVEQWETWTGMVFPESGSYVIEGALQPLEIEREKNVGKYSDPNYWMEHPLTV